MATNVILTIILRQTHATIDSDIFEATSNFGNMWTKITHTLLPYHISVYDFGNMWTKITHKLLPCHISVYDLVFLLYPDHCFYIPYGSRLRSANYLSDPTRVSSFIVSWWYSPSLSSSLSTLDDGCRSKIDTVVSEFVHCLLLLQLSPLKVGSRSSSSL